MNWLSSAREMWRGDKLLQRVFRNSGYLFSGNTINMVLSLVQSAFAAHLLGVINLGVLGIITTFASTVNRLFSFRMGEVVVKYAGEALVQKQTGRAAAVVKAAALTEAATSIMAFIFLVLVTPIGVYFFIKDPQLRPQMSIWFIIYGLIIPGNLICETSTGVLQLANEFRNQAAINVVQSVLTAMVIVAAFFAHWGLPAVLLAYLLGKVIMGTGPAVLAWSSLRRLLGEGWWRASFKLLPPWKELARFAIGTNLSATVNLLVRDNEQLWVAFFLSEVAVGYYKVALAINNLILMPITPFISTTYPEINRCVVGKEMTKLRQLLRRVTFFSGAWTLAAALGLMLLGQWIIPIYAGKEFLPAYPAMLVLLLGFGMANIFFWNRNLLLSFNLPIYPLKVMIWCGVFKVLLAFVLVPRFGFVAEAALLTGYFVISVTLIVLRGMKEIRSLSVPESQPGINGTKLD